MKKMNFEQMEQVNGGCTDNQQKVIAYAGAVAFVGMFVPFGALIFGPLGGGMALASIVCAHKNAAV